MTQSFSLLLSSSNQEIDHLFVFMVLLINWSGLENPEKQSDLKNLIEKFGRKYGSL